jgi:hypothetical protein
MIGPCIHRRKCVFEFYIWSKPYVTIMHNAHIIWVQSLPSDSLIVAIMVITPSRRLVNSKLFVAVLDESLASSEI